MARQYICPKCHHVGKAAGKKRGSGKAEFMGWMMFPLGVPYTLWRIFCKQPICRACGHEILIDLTSPVGECLYEEHHTDPLHVMEKF